MPRRSLVLPQDGPPEGETVDTTDERRMRRSIIRSSLAPNDLRRSVLTDSTQRTRSGTPGSAPPVSPQVFFNCLKLAAENKINAKNAFSLAMIDYLSYAVKSGSSPLSNFQLAGCSLDAGTKIYAARVDHVAGGMAEFAISMSMMHKKAQAKAAQGMGDMEMGDDSDEQGAAKKKKKKGKSRSLVIVRDVKELMMDMSKTIPKNKMFSIVGNLMDEAIDSASFSFCDRSRVGSVKDMTPTQLEGEKGDYLPVNTVLPTLPEECDLCPSLNNFKFGTIDNSLDWSHLVSTRLSRRNTRLPQATDSPRLTLSQQNLDPGLDEAAAQPFDEPDDFQNFSMGSRGGTIIEEVAACGAAARRPEAVADNEDDFEFSVRLPEPSLAFSFQINEKELRPLHGPFFWKYKRPTLRNIQNSERPPPTTARKALVDDKPVDFSGPMPDLNKLMKKRSKTYLSRDTLLRWNPDRQVLPTEDCDDALIINDMDTFPSILDVGMVVGLKIPALDPNMQRKATGDAQDGSQKVPYDFDNEADKQDYCPFPNQPLMPSDDEDDVELGQEAMEEDDGLEDAEAMQNLFQLLNDSTAANSQYNDIFSESHLLPEPANVVTTVAPVWKTMRGINMRLMEALMWKQIDVPEQSEEEKLAGRWKLRQLRNGLPKKTQNAASVTTTLYALLNLANKKGLMLQANTSLSRVTLHRLNCKEDKSRRSRVHPALLSN